MAWPGRYTVEGHVGGRNGFPVLLGGSMVPRVATFHVEGLSGAPDATVRIEVRQGRPECIEIVVKAQPEGRGISTSDMSLFNIDNLIANVLREVAVRVEQGDGGELRGTEPGSESARWAADGDIREARQVVRRGANPKELEEVARVYLAHLASGPAKAVRDLLGYSDRTAARRIALARQQGLIPIESGD